MLVLARRAQERVVIATANDLQELARVTVLGIDGRRVKLGIDACNDLLIYREEVWERACQELMKQRQEPKDATYECRSHSCWHLRDIAARN